ncbi:MAG: hypothetical protein IJR52_09270 [Selenomonadaceae bacterium]|nr:hypothetical protein [Selenomonadaceae bacterium]MBQ9497745.1 hypothetical protein [Selenomonadaceae bacterium]
MLLFFYVVEKVEFVEVWEQLETIKRIPRFETITKSAGGGDSLLAQRVFANLHKVHRGGGYRAVKVDLVHFFFVKVRDLIFHECFTFSFDLIVAAARPRVSLGASEEFYELDKISRLWFNLRDSSRWVVYAEKCLVEILRLLVAGSG